MKHSLVRKLLVAIAALSLFEACGGVDPHCAANEGAKQDTDHPERALCPSTPAITATNSSVTFGGAAPCLRTMHHIWIDGALYLVPEWGDCAP